jgi:TonB-dependent SusC/RagA subfamily outer membrane receptor
MTSCSIIASGSGNIVGTEERTPTWLRTTMKTPERHMAVWCRPLVGLAWWCLACAAPAATPRPSPVRSDTGLSGHFTAASSDEWDGRVVARTEELFIGRFPGVQVFRTPQGVAVRIRGSGGGSGEPLYVLDGTPLQSTTGGLIALNPSDIAKIEVLKDIAATASYGVRGANGVILITTKR